MAHIIQYKANVLLESLSFREGTVTTNLEGSPYSTADMDSPRSQTTSTDQPNTWLELAIRGRLSQLCEDERSSFLEASPSLAEVDLLSYVKDYDERHKELSVMHPQAERLANFVRIMRDFMAGVSARSHSKPDISALVLGGIRAAVDASMAFETFFTKNVVVIESMATVIFDLLIFCRDVCRVIGKYREARSSVSIWTFIRTHWDPFETGFTDLEAKLKLHLEIIRGSAVTSLLDETYRGNFEVQMDFYWEQNREKGEYPVRDCVRIKYLKKSNPLSGRKGRVPGLAFGAKFREKTCRHIL